MTVSRRLAWGILLSIVLTSALLRHFHQSTPQSTFLPWPIRSLLFFLLIILFLVFIRGWGVRQEVPYAGKTLTEFNLLAMVPLMIALVGEKWFSITFYAPVLEAAHGAGLPPPVVDALAEVLAGVGIVGVSLVLLPLFPRLMPLLRDFLSVRALATGVAGIVSALALMYGLIGVGLLLLGGQEIYLVPRWWGSWAGIRFSGQALVSLGEEIYYRGLLQTELIFLLPALGLRNRLHAIGAGIGILSLQFALEHLGGGPAGASLSMFLYTLITGLFLGVLLITVRSLYLCAFAHFVMNLFVLGGGLQFTDQLGRPVIDASFYISMLLIVLTIQIYILFAPERRELVRRKASGPRLSSPQAG